MQHTNYGNFGGVKIPRDVGSESQGSPNVHVKILRQNANACLQLPTSSGGAVAVKAARELRNAAKLANIAFNRAGMPVLRCAQTLALPPGGINAVPLGRCRGEGILVFRMEEKLSLIHI